MKMQYGRPEKTIPRENLLLIFCRYPELGKVKTRLAKEIGQQGALLVYESLLERLCETLLNLDSKIHFRICLTPDPTGLPNSEPFQGQFRGCTDFVGQGEGDLGQKISRAVEQAFKEGFEKVVCIGADCPDLEASFLELAFKKLRTADVVLGPALDGGYYLLGLKAPHLGLFMGISWGSSRVLAETLDLVSFSNLISYEMEPLTDVDTWSDLLQVRRPPRLPPGIGLIKDAR